ncbi:MAG: hypothetical protein U0270_01430 [Labilithrix sp.]
MAGLDESRLGLASEVGLAADAFLDEIPVDRLDPAGTITPSSRRLCAGLGLLGQATYRALGGTRRGDEVGLAGAMLSLLTKLDDQVIDARDFHAGTSREAAAEKTRAYLAPTLASIRSGAPASDDERCVFAARLGRRLRALGSCEHVIETIARGWEVQAIAVSTLTRHASEVTLAEVESVTRDISGVWLLMITEIGTIGTRALTREESDAFQLWGDAIQKADALNDLTKDIADGHWSTYPLKVLFERSSRDYERARAGADVDVLLAKNGVAEVCFDPGLVQRAASAHAGLGDVQLLLRWIHEHLTARWHARRGG